MSALIVPIALFVYKRLAHLEKTIDSLKKNYLNEYVILYIFSDGPKKPDDANYVENVRNYIKDLSGFSKIILTETKENQGLSTSIISGISKVLEEHDHVIVLEDDLDLSPYFLSYMTEGLTLYRDDPRIASIHGYSLPVKDSLPETFFLKGADCWGWGTWKRAWDTFEKNGELLLNRLTLKKCLNEFDLDGSVGNTQMLKDQIIGKNDSWAIRWHASCFLNNMLTLHPGQSLVKNIGLDGSGEHCIADLSLDSKLSFHKPEIKRIEVNESRLALNIYKKFYKNQRGSFLKRILKTFREKIC